MSDYISREAAKNALREQCHRLTVADEANGYGNVKWSEYVIYAETAENAIDAIPAADVKPVVRGKWEERNVEGEHIFFNRRFYCSVCGGWNTYGKPKYCPDCGARMEK